MTFSELGGWDLHHDRLACGPWRPEFRLALVSEGSAVCTAPSMLMVDSDNNLSEALLWEYKEFQDRTVMIWEAIAERYRGFVLLL
jgi:hypothetical protein